MRFFQLLAMMGSTVIVWILLGAGCRGDHLDSFASRVRSAGGGTLYEGLPHQKFENPVMEQELVSKATVQMDGFPFYQETLTLSEADERALREIVCRSETFAELPRGVEKSCGGFHPDYCIEWRGSNEKLYRVLICFGCHEAMLCTPSRSIRYDIEKEAFSQLETILSSYQKSRPARSRTGSGSQSDKLEYFVSAVRNAVGSSLFEGLPHQMYEKPELEKELASKATVQIGGFPFYQDTLAINESDEKRLREIVCGQGTFEPFSGEKKCGGFHPDYCVELSSSDGRRFHVLICFGCHEAMLRGPADSIRYDIEDGAFTRLESILIPYRKNRPSTSHSNSDSQSNDNE